MGPNGILSFLASFFGDSSATGRTHRVRGNGNVTLIQIGITTNSIADFSFQVKNRGTTTAQFGSRSYGIGGSGSTIGGAWQYAAVDTNVDQTISISMQLSGNTATAMWAGLLAEVKYGE